MFARLGAWRRQWNGIILLAEIRKEEVAELKISQQNKVLGNIEKFAEYQGL